MHSPVKAYTPLFTEFSYQSGFRLDASTGSTRFQYTGFELDAYRANPDGHGTEYARNLFYMTRDVLVLEKLATIDPTKGFYCVRNEQPIQSDLNEDEFKKFYNVNTVYPCNGPLHDQFVPKCVCPVLACCPKTLAVLKQTIAALQLAAPFRVRVAKLHSAAASAHKAAAERERAAIAPSALLVFSLEKEEIARVVPEPDAEGATIQEGNDDEPYWGLNNGDYANTRSARQLAVDKARVYDNSRTDVQRDALARAKEARTAADLADLELAEYIDRKENEAFALFEPNVRTTLTVARLNTVGGYPVPDLSRMLVTGLLPAYKV